MKKKLLAVICSLCVVALAGQARAQSEPGALSGPSAAPGAPVADPDKTQGVTPNDSFGTTDLSVLWIPMAAFQPRNGASTWAYQSTGYVSRASGSDLLWAPLTLPNGSLIDTVRAWIFDNSANSISVFLTQFAGTSDGATDIGSATSTGTGETSIAFFPAFTVNYSSNMYVIYLNMPIDANIRAKGVRVLWYRQVSAAPGIATFSDVPTSHWAFRYIEALVASGVTSGCAAGQYCPNGTVTRAEMAVFLADALGMHHPF